MPNTLTKYISLDALVVSTCLQTCLSSQRLYKTQLAYNLSINVHTLKQGIKKGTPLVYTKNVQIVGWPFAEIVQKIRNNRGLNP